MKLKELFVDIGLQIEREEEEYNMTKRMYVPTGKIVPRVPSCHSSDRKMIANHMDDELPFYAKLGPITVFAIKIPTAERYTMFVADSIGFSSYEISRYRVSPWGREKFAKIKDKLMHPAPSASFESDEFKIFGTLQEINRGNEE